MIFHVIIKCDDFSNSHPNDEVIKSQPMYINRCSCPLKLIHTIIFQPQRKYLLSELFSLWKILSSKHQNDEVAHFDGGYSPE